MNTKDLIRFYWQFVRLQKKKLSIAFIFVIASVGMGLARPWPLKVIFDYVLMPQEDTVASWTFLRSQNPMVILLFASVAIVVISAAFGLFEYLYTIIAGKSGQKIVFGLRDLLYVHVQRLSLGFHTRTRSGDLLSRLLRDVNQLRDFLSESAVSLLSEMVLVLGMVSLMLWIDWELTMIGIALLPIMMLAIFHYSNMIRGLTRKRLQKEGAVASMFHERLAAIQEVQLFTPETTEDRRFQEENRKNYKAELRALRSKGQLLRVVELVTATGTCLVLYIGARKVLNQVMSPGDLLVFFMYLRNLFRPLRRIASNSVQLSKAAVAAERVAEILCTEPEIQDAPDAVPAPVFRGAIEFCNVSFSYGGERRALRDISFKVSAGQTVAVVGPSGAGKTTLIGLIPRLHDVSTGSVHIDGEDIRRYKLASLRKQVAVVPQEPVLLAASVRENIAFGEPDATWEAVRHAATLAYADDFIRALPCGYDTELGERGASLSGGQRQRIAIARALLRKAPIVLLDEPMSGLDIQAETHVLQALDNLLRDRTAFVIAHRIATVWKADMVLVLEEGRLAEVGTPKDLLHAKGAFQRFSELEFGFARSERGVQ